MELESWNVLGRELARRRTLQAAGPRFRALWRMIRFGVPPVARFCFEGHPALEGQLWFAERRLLWKTVRAYRPRTCVEVGTWRGGGSTLFTAHALRQNGSGMLHTWEIDADLHETARRTYEERLPQLARHLTFHLGDHRAGHVPAEIDCLMLDGPEDAQSTLDQLRFFESRLVPRSLVLVHDWHTEKARLVRSLLEEGAAYRIVARVDPPYSVGFVVAQKAGS